MKKARVNRTVTVGSVKMIGRTEVKLSNKDFDFLESKGIVSEVEETKKRRGRKTKEEKMNSEDKSDN